MTTRSLHGGHPQFHGSAAKSILVIGAATLDRLLYVDQFPKADSKYACETHEMGGGNAANTATAIGRLTSAARNKEYFPQNVQDGDADTGAFVHVKLLTKIALDDIGNSLVQELQQDGVDISSPLFLRCDGRSPIVTVLVTTKPPYTRTCLFDPGTVGTLHPSDLEDESLQHVDCNVSDIMKDCIHLHSDTRHTEVALILAREASKRGIPISLDVERDRFTEAFDELLDLSNLMFTNEGLMDSIVSRRFGCDLFDNDRSTEMEIEDKDNCGIQQDNHAGLCDNCDNVQFYCNVVKLFHCFKKESSNVLEKELVVTRGQLGAVHCKLLSSRHSEKIEDDDQHSNPSGSSTCSTSSEACVHKFKVSRNDYHIFRITHKIYNSVTPGQMQENDYIIHVVGTLKDIDIVDTTGAGDAFIGGYIYSSTHLAKGSSPQGSCVRRSVCSSSSILFKLRYSAWVAGRKIGGIGARTMLPFFDDSLEILGGSLDQQYRSLLTLIS